MGIFDSFEDWWRHNIHDNRIPSGSLPTPPIENISLPPLIPEIPADLAGSQFNLVNASVNAGDTINIDYGIHNYAPIHSGNAFVINFYLSTDDSISTDDYYLGSDRVWEGIAGNSTSTILNTSFDLPKSDEEPFSSNGDGTYYVGMIINNPHDTDTSDNSNVGQFFDYDSVSVSVPEEPFANQWNSDLGLLNSTPVETSSYLQEEVYDNDVYSFLVNETSNLNLSLNQIAVSDDADLELYRDVNNNDRLDSYDQLITGSYSGSGDDELINHQVETGNYLARVYYYASEDDNIIDYNLALSATSIGQPSNVIAAEYNFANIQSSYGNTLQYGMLDRTNTSDIYFLSVAEGQVFNLTLDNLSSDADLRVIQDSNNNYIVDEGEVYTSSTNEQNDADSLSIEQPGDYYVQVYLYETDSSTEYDLSFEDSLAIDLNLSQITDNEKDDRNPLVSEYGDIVWEHQYGESDTDIYYHDYLGENSEIATNANNENNPDISALGNVVFEQHLSSEDTDIGYYNYATETTTTIADSLNHETNPQIDGVNVVYEYQYGINDRDIYLYNSDTQETTTVAGSTSDQFNPQIAGDYIFYSEDVEVVRGTQLYDHYLYDIATGESNLILGDRDVQQGKAKLSAEGHIVYPVLYDPESVSLRLYDNYTGDTIDLVTGIDATNPEIAGNYVTWQASDGNDSEIYRYDHNTGDTIQLTDNEVDDVNPVICDRGYVVWEHQYSSEDTDIYLHTGTREYILANTTYNETNPDIFGAQVSWQGWDGSDWEIYRAEIVDV